MNILEAFCGVVLLAHTLDATSTDCTCTTKIYVSSDGFSCYPCPPGFRLLKECRINATTNICIPCPEGYFQPTCTTQATRCRRCGSCPEPKRQEITRNCTKTRDTTCACLENYSWDTHHRICLRFCPEGKKIVQGDEDEGEGLLCVPCEADTFSNETNSRKCEPCSSCSAYKTNCTKTSDAVCHQLTTKTVITKMVTSENVTSPTTITDRQTSTTHPCIKESLSTCEESSHSERNALIAVSVLFALCIVAVIVFIACKWRKISKEFPCCKKSRQKHNNNAEKKNTNKEERDDLLKKGNNSNEGSGENAATAHTDQQQKKTKAESEAKGTTTHNAAIEMDARGPIISINPELKPDLPTPGQKSFSI